MNGQPEDGGESLRTIYAETCRSHDGISDFRAKLLGLLPTLSFAAIFTILKPDNGFPDHLFLPAGIFGAIVSFGLFLYELRGIQRCKVLRGLAAEIECLMLRVPEETGGKPWMSVKGPFARNPKAAFREFAGAESAGLIIYSAVISAWSYISMHECAWTWKVFVPVLAGVACVLFGRTALEPTENNGKKRSNDRKDDADQDSIG